MVVPRDSVLASVISAVSSCKVPDFPTSNTLSTNFCKVLNTSNIDCQSNDAGITLADVVDIEKGSQYQ